MLANPKLKRKLINYIMAKFRNFALLENSSCRINIMLDFEGVDCPVRISCGANIPVPS